MVNIILIKDLRCNFQLKLWPTKNLGLKNKITLDMKCKLPFLEYRCGKTKKSLDI